MLRCIATTFPQITTFHGVDDRPNESDHPSGRAVDAMIPDWATPAGNELGWQAAEWVQANHVCLGVTYVIWDAQIFSADRAGEGWRPYEHPNGWTDANSAHRNHVHVSVHGESGACVDGAWVVPIAGDYVITARFGQGGERWANRHTGVDLAAPLGRPVLAAAVGQVSYAGWDGPYGQRIEITHLDGTKTWYAHLSSIAVADGAFLPAGAQRATQLGFKRRAPAGPAQVLVDGQAAAHQPPPFRQHAEQHPGERRRQHEHDHGGTIESHRRSSRCAGGSLRS